MKVMIVAMTGSIHTARWMRQIRNEGFDIYLFPAQENLHIHPELANENISLPFAFLYRFAKRTGLLRYYSVLHRFYCSLAKKADPGYHSRKLARQIKRIQPALIHSLETQGAGYLVAGIKTTSEGFPKWWHTNWGSDIHLFGRMPEHRERIKNVLAHCDYYSCECSRDVTLAREFGFSKHAFPVYPNTGGFDIERINQLRKESPVTSARKTIMLKGYQGWAGRALTGIRALERCKDVLSGFEIVIYSNTDATDIRIASTLLSQNLGIPVKLLPEDTSNDEILRYHSNARISIGLSISDAISTSLLEAMAMGSFPVQSCTACTAEWFTDGVSGSVVPPEDPETIEQAIRKALADDSLVDEAALINLSKITKDANFATLKQLTIQSYRTIFNQLKDE